MLWKEKDRKDCLENFFFLIIVFNTIERLYIYIFFFWIIWNGKRSLNHLEIFGCLNIELEREVVYFVEDNCLENAGKFFRCIYTTNLHLHEIVSRWFPVTKSSSLSLYPLPPRNKGRTEQTSQKFPTCERRKKKKKERLEILYIYLRIHRYRPSCIFFLKATICR